MTNLPFHHPEHPRVFRDPNEPVSVEADVCVIGSGAGGATIASELAEAGLKVAILEKGPYVTHVDMTQLERDMLPLMFEGSGGRTTRDGGFLVWHASCVGGTTVVNNAICFDTPDRILNLWHKEHGVEGMAPADFAPSLAKVRFIWNVHKIQEHEINENARVMMRGAEKIGLKGDLFEHNRTECVQSGFCMVGCSYDRKQNQHITYIPRALSHGATLYPDTLVEKLEAGSGMVTRAVGKVKNRKTGTYQPLEVKARLFIVAGGAISTPMLLLRSGLANSSGQVGRNLHCHPTAPVVADMGDAEIHFYRGIPQVFYIEQLANETDDTGGFILESIAGGPAQSSGLFPIWGPKLHEIMARYNHYAGAFVQVHDTNTGTVTVGKHGVPVVDYTLREPDAARLRRGYQALGRIYLAAGARQMIIPTADIRQIRNDADIEKLSTLDVSAGKVGILTAHQMGTCRMGEDPRKAVVDSGGKAHDLDNLYVADSSVFPTSIGVNPQITIASLATHFARRIIRDRARIFPS